MSLLPDVPGDQVYRLLVENAKDYAILVLDPGGRITHWNLGAERLFGWREDEVLGQDSAVIFTPEDRERQVNRSELERALHDGRSEDDRWHIRKDGSRLWASGVVTPLRDEQGRHLGFVKIARDLTEIRRVEERLEAQAAELARSNAELQQFAYVVAHDLKEPLRMVTSYTGLLSKRFIEQLPEDAREFLQYITEGATRMGALIDGLLRYSTVSRAPLRHDVVSTKDVLAQVSETLSMSLEESGASVEADTFPDVRGDPVQLAQLFQNLISNALKFAGRAPPRIRIEARPEGDQVLFRVQDAGIGIPSEQLERVFHLFQRLHPRDVYPGTGLGLSICRKIVERHGGRMWAEAPPEGGTAFLFTLPAASEGGVEAR